MTVSTPTREPQDAQARGAAYTLIARCCQYPDRALIETLADPARWSTWPDILEVACPRIGEALQSVRALIQTEASRLADGSEAEPIELQQRFDNLFGHAVRGKCPAYELEYGRSEIIQQASELADLAGFYRAFGMEMVDETNGRPDHITVECELMSALCAKEAHAIGLPDEGKADICLDAERVFLRDHLARWLPAFAHRVATADATGLYGSIARFASAFMAAECDRFEIRLGPQTLELRPADPVQDRTISCRPADCGSQAPGEQFVQLDVGPGLNQKP